MGDDAIAVAKDFAIVVDIGQLPSRRGFRVDDVDVAELEPAQLQEGEDLEAVGIVVGDAEQIGVGEERQQCTVFKLGRVRIDSCGGLTLAAREILYHGMAWRAVDMGQSLEPDPAAHQDGPHMAAIAGRLTNRTAVAHSGSPDKKNVIFGSLWAEASAPPRDRLVRAKLGKQIAS